MQIWSLEFNNPSMDELLNMLQSYTEKPVDGIIRLRERQIDKIDNLKVEIFSKEHPPPHFRVTYNDISNDFTIKDCEPLHGSALRKYFRIIKKWHEQYKPILIQYWNQYRPGNCPVGYYYE